VPEIVQERVYHYLDPSIVATDFVRSIKFFNLISDSQASNIKLMQIEAVLKETGLISNHQMES
jgi:hypothetical protein